EAEPVRRQVDHDQTREDERSARLHPPSDAHARLGHDSPPVRQVQGERARELPAARRAVNKQRRTRRALALLVCSFAMASRAAAQEHAPQPAEDHKTLSPYEQDTIRHVLARRPGDVVDPRPEGKTIERIDIVALEVLEDRDPLPTFAKNILNFFHATTREGIIRRELLEGVGDPYDANLIDETARNLRSFPRLSLVLIVPLRGSSPDKVRLVVITKDVWSLRLNTDYRISTAGGLEYLLLQPSEENLLGTHQAISGQFIL